MLVREVALFVLVAVKGSPTKLLVNCVPFAKERVRLVLLFAALVSEL